MGVLGKLLMGLGAAVFLLGALVWLGGRLEGLPRWASWLGRLPGDVHIQRPGFSFYAPITSSLLISLALSLLLGLLLWFLRK